MNVSVNHILEHFDKNYDKVSPMVENEFITINDVVNHKKIEFYPESSPEYSVSWEQIAPNIIKEESVDMSRCNPKQIKYYFF